MTEATDKVDRAKTAHIDQAIGKRLREHRDALGLTRNDVAEVLDVSASSIQHYEDGERIPASRLWQFCAHYGIEVGDLFEGLPHHLGPEAPPVAPPRTEGGEAAGSIGLWGGGVGETDGATLFEVDLTAVAIGQAVLKLNPVERSVVLAAVRGIGIKKLKKP